MSPDDSWGPMRWVAEEGSSEPSADYEVTNGETAAWPEGTECIPVEWTDEERIALYHVEWEEPRHESSFWNFW